MTDPAQDRLVRALLERYGQTYAEEAGIRLADTPAPLFQLLVAANLFSARIGAGQAVKALRALWAEGLTTARHMHEATWERRVQVFNRSGYARYDESTSRMLGDSSGLLLDRYHGDLRRLRDEAAGEVAEIHRRLKDFKGIGDVGADIFLREVQAVWDQVFPFLDHRAAANAEQLGLPATAEGLEGLVAREDFARLVAALVRVGLDKGFDAVRAEAGRG
jgi:hypothetical protein